MRSTDDKIRPLAETVNERLGYNATQVDIAQRPDELAAFETQFGRRIGRHR